MSKNLFGLVLELESDDDSQSFPLTIGGVCRWVKKEFGLDVSKSSVCAVRDKCGAEKLEVGAGKRIPVLKSDKEIAVLEAFRVMGLLSDEKSRETDFPAFLHHLLLHAKRI